MFLKLKPDADGISCTNVTMKVPLLHLLSCITALSFFGKRRHLQFSYYFFFFCCCFFSIEFKQKLFLKQIPFLI